jgi:hypothetical protein
LVSGRESKRKLGEALEMAVIRQRAYRSFTQGLLKNHAKVVKSWEASVIAWEQDMTLPCPYDVVEEGKKFSPDNLDSL